jgi:hypothetical protein
MGRDMKENTWEMVGYGLWEGIRVYGEEPVEGVRVRKTGKRLSMEANLTMGRYRPNEGRAERIGWPLLGRSCG